jgi:hypothetical protein
MYNLVGSNKAVSPVWGVDSGWNTKEFGGKDETRAGKNNVTKPPTCAQLIVWPALQTRECLDGVLRKLDGIFLEGMDRPVPSSMAICGHGSRMVPMLLLGNLIYISLMSMILSCSSCKVVDAPWRASGLWLRCIPTLLPLNIQTPG